MSLGKEQLRWGILGAGHISHDWAIAVSTLPLSEHKIVAVAARSLERATVFAGNHGIPKVHAAYEDLAKDPEIDAVYIGVIHLEHLRLGKMVPDNGKHVLCEKPLCMNVRETQELVDYARAKKLFLMEAVWSRFFPAYLRLREEIDKGTIGEVMQVHVEMGFNLPQLKIDEDHWLRVKELGGGTYTTQFATYCFKGLHPEKILAAGHLNATGADDSSSATIIYPGGKTATLITHFLTNLPNEAVVAGTKGYIKLPFPFWSANKLEMPDGQVLYFPLPESSNKTQFWNRTGLSYQCLEVRKCIREGLIESPLMSHEETILLAEIMESIRRQVGVVYHQDKK